MKILVSSQNSLNTTLLNKEHSPYRILRELSFKQTYIKHVQGNVINQAFLFFFIK